MLHTISSFFPGTFSIWFAGIINIIFAVLTLFVARNLATILFHAPVITNLFSIVFAFSAEVLSATRFFRMYVVAMFFVTLLTYLFVKIANEPDERKNYLILFIASVLSALTHYYCVIYLVFLSAVYGTWCLAKKLWKHLLRFTGIMTISGITAIAIFPAMLSHVFSGYRGNNSLENFTNASFSDYINRLSYFFSIFDNKLLGHALLCLILLIIVIIFSAIILKSRHFVSDVSETETHKNKLICWGLITLPTILYFLLISKIAVAYTERYMFPIYATATICFIGFLHYITHKFLMSSIRNISLCVICVVSIIGSWQAGAWPYLYTETKTTLETFEEYKNVQCIVIYDSMHHVQTTYPLLHECNKVSFIDVYTYYWIAEWECSKNDELMILLIGDYEYELKNILKLCPNLNSYQKLFNIGAGTLYYLH